MARERRAASVLHWKTMGRTTSERRQLDKVEKHGVEEQPAIHATHGRDERVREVVAICGTRTALECDVALAQGIRQRSQDAANRGL